MGSRAGAAPRSRGRAEFAPSEIREQGETGQATTPDFRVLKWDDTQAVITHWGVTKAGLLTGDFMAAVEYLR